MDTGGGVSHDRRERGQSVSRGLVTTRPPALLLLLLLVLVVMVMVDNDVNRLSMHR